MAATPSVKVIKSGLPFRGGTVQFTNRYHFNGGTPADASHWHTLMDAIVTAEKAIYRSFITITEVIGYAAGSEVPVASKTYSTAGTRTDATSALPAAETCGMVRWATSARTSKNHPVYLFNYWHGPALVNDGNDTLLGGVVTAYDTYAAAWISGFGDGSITAVRAGPNGATATGYFVDTYARHHDFPT